MRLLVTALTLTLLVTGGGGQDHQVSTRLRDSTPVVERHASRGPCDEERWLRITPKEWTHSLVAGLIRCAVARWPVPGGAPKAIATWDCESSLYAWAHNGGNLGVAQISAWTDRARAWLRRAWFNRFQARRVFGESSGAYVARANVLAGVRWAHFQGWSAWSCA